MFARAPDITWLRVRSEKAEGLSDLDPSEPADSAPLVLGSILGAEDRPEFLRPDSEFRKTVTPMRCQ
jgi:hypothetical protein